jgi:predicted ABC-type ATPase
MFAGPNGSGKTTIKLGLQKRPEWFGIYINPDDVERAVRETGGLSLTDYGLTTTTEELQSFFRASELLKSRDLSAIADAICCQGHRIELGSLEMNAYYASVLADLLRRKSMDARKSFSFETVMSSSDKIELLREAQARGYRTYLYFVATDDPSINVDRVRLRVSDGGHDVPEEKIRARYHRSLGLASQAIRCANRAFFFDTSGQQPIYFAEVTNGEKLELKTDDIPNWFRPIWEQFE